MTPNPLFSRYTALFNKFRNMPLSEVVLRLNTYNENLFFCAAKDQDNLYRYLDSVNVIYRIFERKSIMEFKQARTDLIARLHETMDKENIIEQEVNQLQEGIDFLSKHIDYVRALKDPRQNS